jgi:hypothetical protein
MWRILGLWFAASIVTAAAWSFALWLRDLANEDDPPPENDEQVRRRVEQQREAGVR